MAGEDSGSLTLAEVSPEVRVGPRFESNVFQFAFPVEWRVKVQPTQRKGQRGGGVCGPCGRGVVW